MKTFDKSDIYLHFVPGNKDFIRVQAGTRVVLLPYDPKVTFEIQAKRAFQKWHERFLQGE